MPSLNIALAEDEPVLRELFSYWLREMGHKVNKVDNGLALLHMCRTTPIDLIISDVKMPHMDGLTAVSILRQELGLPAVLSSGSWSETEKFQAEESGAAVLAKPFRAFDLLVAMGYAATCRPLAMSY